MAVSTFPLSDRIRPTARTKKVSRDCGIVAENSSYYVKKASGIYQHLHSHHYACLLRPYVGDVSSSAFDLSTGTPSIGGSSGNLQLRM